MAKTQESFLCSLVSGGAAGTAVDVVLFPLDTVKTRMQSAQGFWKAGGFRGIYSGLLAAASGSAPTAALFFGTYEQTKKVLYRVAPESSPYAPLVHVCAGSCGEVVACLIRVPTENVKQKLQAKLFHSVRQTVGAILSTQGPKGFFTGYWTTVMREVPFAFVQYPIWEYSKRVWSLHQHREVSPAQAALCGSLAGGIGAAVTTPMDVIKTRLMLGHDYGGQKYHGMVDTFSRVYRQEGLLTLFSGIGPRIMWISIGGAVFFGAYETAKKYLTQYF